jgi:hypothetical protein
MNDVRTDGNSDRIYGAENTAKGVAEQVKKDKKRRLNVIEQKVSEFDRIGASCVGGRGDVEGELMDDGKERSDGHGCSAGRREEASASCCRGALSGAKG